MPTASCEACAKIINGYESEVLKKNYGLTREALGIRSRKRRGGGQVRRHEFNFIEGVHEIDALRGKGFGVTNRPVSDFFGGIIIYIKAIIGRREF